LAVVVALLVPASAIAQTRRSPTMDERSHNSGTLKNVWLDVVQDHRLSVVRLQIEGKDSGLGTIVSPDGYIVTKASEVWQDPIATLHDGRSLNARLVGVIEDWDLAMLKVDAANLPAIELATDAPRVGQFIATLGTTRAPLALGVISVPPRKITGRSGLLGVRLEPDATITTGARIADVSRDSGAERAGLMPEDIIIAIGNDPAISVDDVIARLRDHEPGDVVKLKVRRGEQELDFEATLGERPSEVSRRSLIQNRMGGELSRRSIGFPLVLQHDTALRPEDVGSPIVTLDGKVVGINIARAGRVESYALPATSLRPLIAQLIAGEMPIDYADKPSAESDNRQER
ncbi:MAG TPA: PDZ domain-containing protein, partial [Tepidisphaeraceae bacterium]|nr:PDZ domain-containing protein [Tepidisphaeraceae bacterium]